MRSFTHKFIILILLFDIGVAVGLAIGNNAHTGGNFLDSGRYFSTPSPETEFIGALSLSGSMKPLPWMGLTLKGRARGDYEWDKTVDYDRAYGGSVGLEYEMFEDVVLADSYSHLDYLFNSAHGSFSTTDTQAVVGLKFDF